jgi:aspartate-semialdehyde dehydrogenase
MNKPLIAITHASSLLAEVLLQQMAESGIKPDSVVLLDDNDKLGSRLAYADTYLGVEDQLEYDYEGLSAVLLLQADEELESLLQHSDTYVIGHFLHQQAAELYLPGAQLPAKPGLLKLLRPEIATLMQVITPVIETAEIEALDVVGILSAAMYDKPGVEQLATQTISLLNSREVENSLFPLQMAFNMLPAANDIELENQLALALDHKISCSIHNILVPAMHGISLSVALKLKQGITLEQAHSAISCITGVTLTDEPVSPLTHCKKGSDMVVFDLHQPQKDAKRLHFWIIADSIRNGLVQNYLNILEVLLKSFL